MQMSGTTKKDEAELVRSASSGDRVAFSKIVNAYLGRVVNHCYRITGNRMDAEDVAQDVFVEAYKKLSSFRGESSLSTWLLRPAHNRSLNYLRDNRKYRSSDVVSLDGAREDSIPLTEKLAGKSSDRPDRSLEIEQNRELLYDSIAALPEKYSGPYTLHKLDGLPHAEIAKLLDLSIPAVEARIHRAKLMLQKEIIQRLKNR